VRHNSCSDAGTDACPNAGTNALTDTCPEAGTDAFPNAGTNARTDTCPDAGTAVEPMRHDRRTSTVTSAYAGTSAVTSTHARMF